MTKKICLCFAVAAMVSLAAVSDASAFFGSRGSFGSCGSSGGSWGGWGSNGSSGSSGSWGSSGSHGGLLRRIFNGSHGSNGSNGSCGSSGGSYGSAGGSAYIYSGDYYVTARPAVTAAPVVVVAKAPVVKTELTLRVPADAKVTLAGVPTKQTGEIRHFTTTKLASGQAWENYQIVVEMEREGKLVREERTITLTGGRPMDLAITTVNTTTLAQATR